MNAFILFLSVLNFCIRIPFFSDVPYGDEVNYFRGIERIASNFPNTFVQFTGYKPPGMFFAPAFLTAHGFPMRMAGRIEVALFSSIALYLVFILGKKAFSKRTGLLAALLLFFYPPFMTQSFMFQDPIPVTMAAVLTVYGYYLATPIGYMAASSLLVLTKETAIIIPTILQLGGMIESKVQKWTYALATLFPFILLFGWMSINKRIFGWYLYPVNTGEFTLANLLERFASGEILHYAVSVFVRYGVWTVSLIMVLLVFRIWKKKMQIPHSYLLFFSVWAAGIFAHMFGPLSIRYVLFVYPFLFLVFADMLVKYTKGKLAEYICVFCCIVFLGANLFHFFRMPANGENSDATLELFRYRSLSRKTVDVLKKYPGAIIRAPWPLYEEITDPAMGYVEHPMNAVSWTVNCPTEHARLRIAAQLEEFNRLIQASPNARVLQVYPTLSGCSEPMNAEVLYKGTTGSDYTFQTYDAISRIY